MATYNTWLVKGYLSGFLRSPNKAARLDGASNLRIFGQVILCLIKPLPIFAALSPWMDFIFPRMVLSRPEKKTLAIGLYNMINSNTNNNFTTFAASAVLAAAPIIILYVCLRKYLIHGVTAGANKAYSEGVQYET